MPTTLLVFPGDEIKMKWKEPYVTEGLNKKLAVNTPPGIYRGFKLSEDPLAGDRTVLVTADAALLDHVAVFETVTGYSLTLRRISGNFTLDLSGYSSATVVVAISGSYAVGTSTAVTVKAYTTAEYAVLSASAKWELVILGSVTVPASGPIAVTAIDRQLTKFAWSQQAAGSLPWKPLLKNGAFEYGTVADSTARFTPFWDAETSGTIDWTLQTGGAESSANRLNAYNGTPGAATGVISQNLWITLQPRQLLKLRFFKKCLTALTSGGPPQLVIEHTSGTKTITIACSATDADWVEVNDQFELSAIASILVKRVYITPNSAVFTASNAFTISNVQLWMQTEAVSSPDWQDERISDEVVRRVVMTAIQTGTTTPWLSKAAVLEFDSTLGYSAQGRVSLLNRDGDAAVASPQLNAPGGVVSNVGTGPATEAIQGQIDNVSGYAVKGTNATGTAIRGQSAASNIPSIQGINSGPDGIGVVGQATGNDSYGVFGQCDGAGTSLGDSRGVYGLVSPGATNGVGVYGSALAPNSIGVYGSAVQANCKAIWGFASGSGGIGVDGLGSGVTGAGVRGMSVAGAGVKGISNSGYGVAGNSFGYDSDTITWTFIPLGLGVPSGGASTLYYIHTGERAWISGGVLDILGVPWDGFLEDSEIQNVYFWIKNTTGSAENVICSVTAYEIGLVTAGDVSGTGDSLTFAAGDITLNDSSASFSSGQIGQAVNILGASNSSNNGIFTIKTRPSVNSITYANASGITETSSFSWSTSKEPNSTEIEQVIATRTFSVDAGSSGFWSYLPGDVTAYRLSHGNRGYISSLHFHFQFPVANIYLKQILVCFKTRKPVKML